MKTRTRNWAIALVTVVIAGVNVGVGLRARKAGRTRVAALTSARSSFCQDAAARIQRTLVDVAWPENPGLTAQIDPLMFRVAPQLVFGELIRLCIGDRDRHASFRLRGTVVQPDDPGRSRVVAEEHCRVARSVAAGRVAPPCKLGSERPRSSP